MLDLIYNEVLLREERGEHPRPDESQQRFPEYADLVRRQSAVHRATGGGTASQPAPETAPGPRGGATLAAEPAGLPAIPGYEVLAEIGWGGMGVVYKARQVELNRLVAVKMIKLSLRIGPSHFARFHTEAEAIARLTHPNIVQIHEVGSRQGQPFFSLELVEGGRPNDNAQQRRGPSEL